MLVVDKQVGHGQRRRDGSRLAHLAVQRESKGGNPKCASPASKVTPGGAAPSSTASKAPRRGEAGGPVAERREDHQAHRGGTIEDVPEPKRGVHRRPRPGRRRPTQQTPRARSLNVPGRLRAARGHDRGKPEPRTITFVGGSSWSSPTTVTVGRRGVVGLDSLRPRASSGCRGSRSRLRRRSSRQPGRPAAPGLGTGHAFHCKARGTT
jgi:hypothetical protein